MRANCRAENDGDATHPGGRVSSAVIVSRRTTASRVEATVLVASLRSG